MLLHFQPQIMMHYLLVGQLKHYNLMLVLVEEILYTHLVVQQKAWQAVAPHPLAPYS